MLAVDCSIPSLDFHEKDIIGGNKMGIIRKEAKKLVDGLPDEASWDDLMYEIYIRKNNDEGLTAADEGRLISHDEVKQRFLKK